MMIKKLAAVLLLSFSTNAFCAIAFFNVPSFTLGVRSDGFTYLTATGNFNSSDPSCNGVLVPNSVFVTPDADPALKAAILQVKAFGLTTLNVGVKECILVDGNPRYKVNEIYF